MTPQTYASPNGCNTNSDKFGDFKDTYEDTNENIVIAKAILLRVLSTMSGRLCYSAALLLSLQSLNLSEFVLQPLGDAYVLPAKGCNLIKRP